MSAITVGIAIAVVVVVGALGLVWFGWDRLRRMRW